MAKDRSATRRPVPGSHLARGTKRRGRELLRGGGEGGRRRWLPLGRAGRTKETGSRSLLVFLHKHVFSLEDDESPRPSTSLFGEFMTAKRHAEPGDRLSSGLCPCSSSVPFYLLFWRPPHFRPHCILKTIWDTV